MIELTGWLFRLQIPLVWDGHKTLVHWLHAHGLRELFVSKGDRKIGYLVLEQDSEQYLIGRSAVQINLPDIEQINIRLNPELPIQVAILIPASRVRKAVKLKHEEPSPLARKKATRYRLTESDLMQEGLTYAAAIGLSGPAIELQPACNVKVIHKAQDWIGYEPAVTLLLKGIIGDKEAFMNAWVAGVGRHRAYGFGCLRIIEHG